LYSQRWIRILRPAQQAVSILNKQSAIGKTKLFSYLTQPASPRLRLAAAARVLPRYFSETTSPYPEEELGLALRPTYDVDSLQWLFEQAAQMKVHGEFKKVQLRNERSEVVGWYLYYLKTDGLSSVIQIAARKGSEGEVIDHLFDHARRRGATVLSGRLEPRFMQEMADRGCFFNRIGCLSLIQSNNAEILNAIHRGDALLTQLEGEWCVTP
jgi:hypothetical protein